MKKPPGRHALVTVTDPAYAAGTAVLLTSVLRCNPWFDGDIFVIAREQTPGLRRALAGLPRLVLQPPSDALAARLSALTAHLPAIGPRQARFYSLDSFALQGYDRILYLDSDMLCRGDLAPLFLLEAPLVACPDRPAYHGLVRDASTFVKVPFDAGAPAGAFMTSTFNAGMMLIDGALCHGDTHAALLGHLTWQTFAAVRSGHTDQVLLNRHFADVVRIASAAYNFLVPDAALIEARTGIAVPDAVLLHFVGPVKPWHPPAAGEAGRDLPRGAGWALWHEARRTGRAGLR